MTSTSRLGTSPAFGIKKPVIAATTANITLSGEQTIDSVAVTAGDRVLVRSQTDTTENGIYVCASGAWARATDFNDQNDVANGTMVLDANDGVVYQCSFSGTYTAGSTALTWATADSALASAAAASATAAQTAQTAAEAAQTAAEAARDDLTGDIVGGDAGKPAGVNGTEDGLVVLDALPASFVGTSALADNAVTKLKMADDSVGLAELDDSEVYANQSEAEAGTENTKIMTALRVSQAVSALGVGAVTADVTYQIGSGGDYATLTAALQDLAHKAIHYESAGVRVTLNIATGESLSEGILVDGIDLGWITITGTDATTNTDATSWNTAVTNYSALMIVRNGGVGPRWEQSLVVTGTGPASFDNVFLVQTGGYLYVDADIDCDGRASVCTARENGCIQFDTGLTFNNCASRALAVTDMGRIHCDGATVRMASGALTGIYALDGGQVSCNGTTVNNDTGGSHGTGFEANNGSYINAENCTDTGATTNGFYITNGSVINAGSSTGTLLVTANTVSAAGIIYK